MSAAEVLVVDDDPDIRSMLGLALDLEGFVPLEARDGVEAVEFLESHPHPALVLLDVMMPRMCGTDVLRAMRADPALADVPVIVLSGDTRAVREAIRLGANDSVAKPIGLDELVAAVRRFVH